MGAMKPAFEGNDHMTVLYTKRSDGDMAATSHWLPGGG